MTTTLMPAPASYRGENGRFLKGNPGGPGNPYVKQVAQLKAALFEALTTDDIQAVMRRMRDAALAGDVAAARLLLEYTVGKPLPGGTASALDAELTERLNTDALSNDDLQTYIRLMEKMQRPADGSGAG
jgi:hypothetical protein